MFILGTQGCQSRELLPARLDHVGKPMQRLRALRRPRSGPRREGRLRRPHRTIDVACIAAREATDDLAGRRVHRFEQLSARGGGTLAPDQRGQRIGIDHRVDRHRASLTAALGSRKYQLRTTAIASRLWPKRAPRRPDFGVQIVVAGQEREGGQCSARPPSRRRRQRRRDARPTSGRPIQVPAFMRVFGASYAFLIRATQVLARKRAPRCPEQSPAEPDAAEGGDRCFCLAGEARARATA
jgi:hypothetical protein